MAVIPVGIVRRRLRGDEGLRLQGVASFRGGIGFGSLRSLRGRPHDEHRRQSEHYGKHCRHPSCSITEQSLSLHFDRLLRRTQLETYFDAPLTPELDAEPDGSAEELLSVFPVALSALAPEAPVVPSAFPSPTSSLSMYIFPVMGSS